MEIQSFNNNFSISSQICESDVHVLKKQGFRSLICNRPDGEGADQPMFTEISRVAAQHGLEAVYLPITMGSTMQSDDVNAFREALALLPKPTLAYCRSGKRASTLWSLTQSEMS